jgi:aryl-alcohol dehydrogenase-like predicted oxidoreductase
MANRKLGSNGPEIFPIGLGCMSLGIADIYSSSLEGEDEAVALIRRALDLGVTMLDTANIYGDSEVKVGAALRGRRGEAVLATKFGVVTDGEGFADEHADGSPAYLRRCLDESLRRLDVDYVDLYYQHRIDPNTPIEETVGALSDLVREGKIGHIGLSEPAPATLRRAHAVHPIAAVQVEYSLFTREPEDELLPLMRELGIALVAYSPLGRGFLGGRFRSPDDLAPDDWRRSNPRFRGENFARNLSLADRVGEIAEEKGCTPSQLALAWLLAQGDDIIPIPGTSSTERLAENVAAVEVRLTDSDLQRIEGAAPRGAVAGRRYGEMGMGLLNH